MPDRHKRTPISIRPPEGDRAWLEAHAAQTGRPVRAIIVDAIARARQEATMTGTTTAPAEITEVIGGLTAVQKGLVLQFLAAADRRAFDAAVALVTTRFPAPAQATEDNHG